MGKSNISSEMSGQWHKIAGALALKLGGDVTLGIDDFSVLDGKSVVVDFRGDERTLRVRVVNNIEAARIEADYEKGR